MDLKTIATRSDLDSFTYSENLYVILGIETSASANEIKAAYRRLALLYHPDRHRAKERSRAEEVFKRINAAYEILSDPVERRRYDLLLRKGADTQIKERAEAQKIDPLAQILEDILRYEHIFADEDQGRLEPDMRNMVAESMISDLQERLVGVVKMSTVPLGYEHEGIFQKGFLVITNLKLLFSFRTQWEVTEGGVRTTYTKNYLRGMFLPEIQKLTITTTGRIARKTSLELGCRTETIVVAPSEKNLGKLLLLCSLWGIPVFTREIADRANDIKSAILEIPQVLGLVLAGVNGLALLCGICSPDSDVQDVGGTLLFLNMVALPLVAFFSSFAAGIGIIRALKAYGRVRIEDLLGGDGGEGKR